jgi:ecotin
MRKKSLQLLIIYILSFPVSAGTAEHPELKAFPLAEKGMERFVIVLPVQNQSVEDLSKVELIVGKDILTDGVNLIRLSNTIKPRQLEGWGYTYYQVSGSSNTINTLMANPEGAQQVTQFVAAPSLHIRYNSRLPIVVYVPQGYQVRYRIWQAADEILNAQKNELLGSNFVRPLALHVSMGLTSSGKLTQPIDS